MIAPENVHAARNKLAKALLRAEQLRAGSDKQFDEILTLLMHDVPDLTALRACVDHLCERPGLSVPLWVNLVALARAIDEDAERWAQFLGLPVRASA